LVHVLGTLRKFQFPYKSLTRQSSVYFLYLVNVGKIVSKFEMAEKDKAAGGSGKKKEPNYVVIPIEEWKLALTRAQDLEDMVASSADIIKICPYDENHRVASSKFGSHLAKCRSNYREKVVARGDMVNPRSCKYNHTHQILTPELFYHEEHCPDRHFVPTYMMYLNPLFEDEEETLEYNLEDYDYDPEELKKMRDGLYLNQFIGSLNFTAPSKPISLEDFAKGNYPKMAPAMMPEGHPDPFEDDPEWPNNPFLPKEDEKALEEAPAADVAVAAESVEAEQTSGDIEMEGACGGSDNPGEDQAQDKYDNEEWWNTSSTGPKFDYLQSAYNPQKPMLKYPPGLNKSQRRKFVEWNTEWMKRIVKHKSDQKARAERGDDDLDMTVYSEQPVVGQSLHTEIGKLSLTGGRRRLSRRCRYDNDHDGDDEDEGQDKTNP